MVMKFIHFFVFLAYGDVLRIQH